MSSQNIKNNLNSKQDPKFVAKPISKKVQQEVQPAQQIYDDSTNKTNENLETQVKSEFESQPPVNQPPVNQPPQKYKFRIEVMEKDYDHPLSETQDFTWKKVNYSEPVYIEASNKQELAEIQSRYNACDQYFKIVECVYKPAETNNRLAEQPNREHQQPVQSVQHYQQNSMLKPKPKIVTIGDIQLKYDGNDVYQKQWIRVTPDEANNFRVIMDQTNKIVPMKGRHFEVRKWVKIQDTDVEDED